MSRSDAAAAHAGQADPGRAGPEGSWFVKKESRSFLKKEPKNFCFLKRCFPQITPTTHKVFCFFSTMKVYL
jgi:hypothetical protein